MVQEVADSTLVVVAAVAVVVVVDTMLVVVEGMDLDLDLTELHYLAYWTVLLVLHTISHHIIT